MAVQATGVGAPPIMMPMADSVGQSWLFFSQYRSSRMVNSSVKRRSAMNMGTFRPAVPAGRACVRASDVDAGAGANVRLQLQLTKAAA